MCKEIFDDFDKLRKISVKNNILIIYNDIYKNHRF